MCGNGLKPDRGAYDKNSCIPKHLSFIEVPLCPLGIGFLDECGNTHPLTQCMTIRLTRLDVAIACLRVCGLDP